MMRDAWHTVAATLAEAGCGLVVGVPSDEPGLLDAALDLASNIAPDAADGGGLRPVVVRDQRAGACIATGHAIVSGRPAVLALTSGPAFPNALAGLAEAASLCVPLIVITTRIPVDGLGRCGFQETDQRSMSSSLVKWHHTVESASQLAWAVRRAVHMAVNGRPGLAVVEISDEVGREQHVPSLPPLPAVSRLRAAPDTQLVAHACDVLREARRPLIVVGGGAKAAGAGPAALRVAELLDAPLMTTATGRGGVPESHPAVVGLVGLYTTPPLEHLLEETDLVVAVGTRLEETVRMGWPHSADVRLVHIDADPYAFGQVIEPEVAILGDATLVLEHLLAHFAAEPERPQRQELPESPGRTAWRVRRMALNALATFRHYSGAGASSARNAVAAVGAEFGEHANYVHENGLHDIWSYHYPLLPVGPESRVVVPGEQTMLGFGLPAAIGAGLARPAAPTVLICGDGALQMNIPALATAAEYSVGLVVVMFDNAGFGWPRRMRVLEGEEAGLTRFRVPFPLDEVVRGLGGSAVEARDPAQLRTSLHAARETAAAGATALIRVPVSDDDVPSGILRVLGDSGGA